MRWIKATRAEGGEIWINMAQVFCITRHKEKGDGREITSICQTGGVWEYVLETPDHLVSAFR